MRISVAVDVSEEKKSNVSWKKEDREQPKYDPIVRRNFDHHSWSSRRGQQSLCSTCLCLESTSSDANHHAVDPFAQLVKRELLR